MNRNEPCACGSGKRYKHCHGRIEPAAATASPRIEAQSAHRAGALRRAEALYRQAIGDNPADVDSLHLLGVVLFERMRYREALDTLWEAAERTGWTVPDIRHNLGLVLAKLLSPDANARQEEVVAAYIAREKARNASPVDAARVSIVLPVYNGACFVARAIASVAAQTYRDIELVVVDDGSTDASATEIAERLSGLAFPAKLVRREHRGAAQAANAGAACAEGRYLAFLGAADGFAADRIERMVAEIARATPLWGFSRVADVGDEGGDDVGAAIGGNRPHETVIRRRDFRDDEPASFTLLDHDVTVVSGNLFIDRDLFRELGGYRDVAQYRGWDVCVRAAVMVEPVVVDEPLYFRSSHDRVRNPASAATTATDRMAKELVAKALSGGTTVANTLCPQFAGNRDLLLRAELRRGHGERLPVPVLRSVAAAWRNRATTASPPERNASVGTPPAKIALVVLGVYRSGTSALARALNLCGATLPAQVMPARLGVNPKGFWESEAVNDLDARLLHNLGADWNRVDFELPSSGTLVDEFRADLDELLAREYGDAPLILVKDPRVCVLASLWQRALTQAGYHPAYVVLVRNPLEVARSLESRGDMPVADGLALWLAYMQRVEAFAGTVDADIVHVRYAELLDDWRRVLQRIAQGLHVPLAIERHAAEIDRFLEPAMRKQQVADTDLDAHPAGPRGEAIRALYRRSLHRCEREATTAGAQSATDRIPPA